MMRKYILLLACAFFTASLSAQVFNDFFANKTLRLDYLFSGNSSRQEIYLDKLSSLPTWAGRRNNLAQLPLKGNGQVVVRDKVSQEVIYKTSFSSLFQEWLETDEAQTTAKGFENTFLVPYPLKAVEIEVVLFNARQLPTARMVHTVNPDDLLIQTKGTSHVTPHQYLLKNGSEDKCIDIAILAEGYTPQEMELFYTDAATACESLFEQEPFKSMKNRFNLVAVAAPSSDSGVSIPSAYEWKHTAFGSHFSTFYSERYLTTSSIKSVHDALAGIAYEHIVILANTDKYGGGGIYNSYTLTTAHHPLFRSVIVHELGHSFGGLADEYFYEEEDLFSSLYPLDVEPWEQNITTRTDFSSKWQDMLSKETPLPTPESRSKEFPVGVYEGGGYLSKGIYRPANKCQMRVNEEPFCLVCRRALQRMIDFYTKPLPAASK